MSYEHILYGVDNRIATITLNRPAKLNPLSVPMTDEVEHALAVANADPEVRVVVLQGAGRSFSAGADLDEKATVPDVEKLLWRHTRLSGRHYWALWESEKPVVASVQGHCLAGAVWMVAMCDLVVAADSAVFGLPQISFNQRPASIPFDSHMSIKFAKELALLGDSVGADRAERMGLVNMVVPAAELASATERVAGRIAAQPRLGVAMQKRSINRLYEGGSYPLVAELEAETLSYANALQAYAGSDEGFRDRVREVGVAAAVRELAER